jgi:hypothetical protein
MTPQGTGTRQRVNASRWNAVFASSGFQTLRGLKKTFRRTLVSS